RCKERRSAEAFVLDLVEQLRQTGHQDARGRRPAPGKGRQSCLDRPQATQRRVSRELPPQRELIPLVGGSSPAWPPPSVPGTSANGATATQTQGRSCFSVRRNL